MGTPDSIQRDTACGEAFRACLAPPVPSHQDYRHDEDSGAKDGSELHMTQPQPCHQQGHYDAEQEYAESGISQSGSPHIERRVARRLAQVNRGCRHPEEVRPAWEMPVIEDV